MSDLFKKKREEGLVFLNKYDKNTFNLVNEKNLSKAIPLFQESIYLAPTDEEKYESSKLLQDTLEKLILGIEKDKLHHEDIHRNYVYYTTKLMEVLSNNMKYSQIVNDTKEAFYSSNAINVIREIPLKDIGQSVYEMIDYFKGFTQTYYSLIGTLMRHYFNDAFKLYDSGKVVQSKNIFYTAFDIQVKYELEPKKLDELNIDKLTKDEIKDVLDSSNYHIKRIDAQIEIDKGDKYLKEGLLEKEEIDMDDIADALTCYRNALNEIGKNKLDIELEAICYSNIAYIMHRVYKNKKKKQKIKEYVTQAVNLGLSLAPKNVGKEKWYINAANILQEIRNEEEKEEERNDDKYREELKKKKEGIFNELYEKKDESNLTFIKFILEKYPYKGYKPKKNIDEEYTKDNKNFIRTLVVKYHPDRYPKSTEEEKEHYVIIHEISSILNNMFSIYEDMNGKEP